jgi:hypothetical protein
MLLIKNVPFTNVVASGVATVSLPIGMSFNRILLELGGGAFTKAMITDIKVRLNGKVIFQNSGSRLDLINTYRKRAVSASYLVVDFTEPDAKDMAEEYLGNLNTAQGVSSLTMEVTISGATTPTLNSYSEYGPPAPLGVLAKQLLFTTSFGGAGKFPFKLIDVANRGAIIKRVHFAHGGNVQALEVKKNGVVIFDNITTHSTPALTTTTPTPSRRRTWFPWNSTSPPVRLILWLPWSKCWMCWAICKGGPAWTHFTAWWGRKATGRTSLR